MYNNPSHTDSMFFVNATRIQSNINLEEWNNLLLSTNQLKYEIILQARVELATSALLRL